MITPTDDRRLQWPEGTPYAYTRRPVIGEWDEEDLDVGVGATWSQWAFSSHDEWLQRKLVYLSEVDRIKERSRLQEEARMKAVADLLAQPDPPEQRFTPLRLHPLQCSHESRTRNGCGYLYCLDCEVSLEGVDG